LHSICSEPALIIIDKKSYRPTAVNCHALIARSHQGHHGQPTHHSSWITGRGVGQRVLRNWCPSINLPVFPIIRRSGSPAHRVFLPPCFLAKPLPRKKARSARCDSSQVGVIRSRLTDGPGSRGGSSPLPLLLCKHQTYAPDRASGWLEWSKLPPSICVDRCPHGGYLTLSSLFPSVQRSAKTPTSAYNTFNGPVRQP